jgi:methionine biosynthesis protein MetW
MPVTRFLTDTWYDTPNIHFCTIRDFLDLCGEIGVTVERSVILPGDGRAAERRPNAWANWMGEQAIFLLTRDGDMGGE